MPSDAQLMQIAINDLNNSSLSLEEHQRALEELLILVEPTDNANCMSFVSTNWCERFILNGHVASAWKIKNCHRCLKLCIVLGFSGQFARAIHFASGMYFHSLSDVHKYGIFGLLPFRFKQNLGTCHCYKQVQSS